jgi:phosphatidate cytidylyltransferase
LIPIAIGSIYLGGLPLLALAALLLTLAEIEFCRLMARDGFRLACAFGIGLLWLLLLDAQHPEWGLLKPGLTLILLASLTWQLFHRQRCPVANWAMTVVGGLYLGLCGACVIALRAVRPDGLWWTLTALPAIVFADTGAFFVGRALGRHKLAPTLSPGKTWEGYVAGVLLSGLLTALLAAFWRRYASAESAIGWQHGLLLGRTIAVIAPLGDLAISMFKRQVGAKDTGTIIPGHGGALDRVDSILWAGVIGYYYVSWFTR